MIVNKFYGQCNHHNRYNLLKYDCIQVLKSVQSLQYLQFVKIWMYIQVLQSVQSSQYTQFVKIWLYTISTGITIITIYTIY